MFKYYSYNILKRNTSHTLKTDFRLFHNTPISRVNIGDKIPSSLLQNGSPGITVNLSEKLANGKYVIVGVPGAFSPGCTAKHVPGYLNDLEDFKKKGVNDIYVVAVNDAFVVNAWADKVTGGQNGKGIHFLADPSGHFTNDLDLLFFAKPFGNERSKRYALVVDDGKVVQKYIEPDGTGITISAAENVLKYI